MKIFGMGGLEIVIILVVILIIFGPKNLPKLGKAIGKSVSSLREGMNSGKKKEEDTPAESAETVPAAEIEAEQPAVVEEEAAEADAASDIVEFADEEEVDEAAEAETADEAEEAVADAEETPKKVVKRVVKKKTVATEEVSEEA